MPRLKLAVTSPTKQLWDRIKHIKGVERTYHLPFDVESALDTWVPAGWRGMITREHSPGGARDSSWRLHSPFNADPALTITLEEAIHETRRIPGLIKAKFPDSYVVGYGLPEISSAYELSEYGRVTLNMQMAALRYYDAAGPTAHIRYPGHDQSVNYAVIEETLWMTGEVCPFVWTRYLNPSDMFGPPLSAEEITKHHDRCFTMVETDVFVNHCHTMLTLRGPNNRSVNKIIPWQADASLFADGKLKDLDRAAEEQAGLIIEAMKELG